MYVAFSRHNSASVAKIVLTSSLAVDPLFCLLALACVGCGSSHVGEASGCAVCVGTGTPCATRASGLNKQNHGLHAKPVTGSSGASTVDDDTPPRSGFRDPRDARTKPKDLEHQPSRASCLRRGNALLAATHPARAVAGVSFRTPGAPSRRRRRSGEDENENLDCTDITSKSFESNTCGGAYYSTALDSSDDETNNTNDDTHTTGTYAHASLESSEIDISEVMAAAAAGGGGSRENSGNSSRRKIYRNRNKKTETDPAELNRDPKSESLTGRTAGSPRYRFVEGVGYTTAKRSGAAATVKKTMELARTGGLV